VHPAGHQIHFVGPLDVERRAREGRMPRRPHVCVAASTDTGRRERGRRVVSAYFDPWEIRPINRPTT
jgi:hypothetical protein